MSEQYQCDSCGACCKFPFVEIEEIDVVREPKLAGAAVPSRPPGPGYVLRDEDGEEVEPMVPAFAFGGILSAGATRPCPMLGMDNLCSIYPTRPNCCVAFRAGGEMCQESRAAHGLPPLLPAGVPVP